MTRRRSRTAFGVAAIALSLVASGCSGDETPPVSEGFAASSPWNSVIASDDAVDPNSVAMVASIQQRPALYASTVQYGIPIYQAIESTPVHTVTCRRTEWRPCPLAGRPIPIPQEARPQIGTDGSLVVVDLAQGLSYEFWEAQQVDGMWTTGFGAIMKLSESGWDGSGASTGAGASRLGGVVRLSEVEGSVIPHALSLQTSNACKGSFRAPATKTNGTSMRPDCIPEGARLQLDPSIDITTLRVSPIERMIAVAMQKYGGFVVGAGGATLAVSMERDNAAPGDDVGAVYTEAGIRWDFDDLSGVPWNKLRVVE